MQGIHHESSQQIELEGHSRTPDQMIKEEENDVLGHQKKPLVFNVKRCMLLLMLIIASAFLGYEINAQDPPHVISHNTISVPEDFNFLIFCPISYFDEKKSFKPSNFGQNQELRRRRLFETYSRRIEITQEQKIASNYDPNRTFIVEVTSSIYNYTDQSGNQQSKIELFYCGLVTGFYGSCNDSLIACSTPGPIFDIPTREPIDIIWVNNLNPSLIPQQGGQSCLNITYFNQQKQYCTLMAKVNKTQTYLDPTKNDIESKTAYYHAPITSQTWPSVTHLHGAEIRPTFDGNPLSWIHNNQTSKGSYGIAAFSYDSQCYYSSFDTMGGNRLNYNPPKIILRDIKTGFQAKNYKINRYPNQQNPGSLWYHDHAMHLTSFNVRNGLSGYYILRDKDVEEIIGVERKCQKLVMLAGNFLKPSFQLTGFKTGQVYRFKFLNNNYGDLGNLDVVRISFSYNSCNDTVQNRQSFTIIGADSSLFNTGIENQKSFVVAQAERMQILIKFMPNMGNFSICGDGNIDTPSPNIVVSVNSDIEVNMLHNNKQKITGLYNIKLSDDDDQSNFCANNRTSIENVVLPVPFVNLNETLDSQIAVKRMRPLIWVHPIFTINGRVDFHGGWSQNPQIGTTQDWFLINTISFSHPIHVHLINFQVVKQYDLRVLTAPSNQCSLYELDFAITALSKSFNDTQVNSLKSLIFTNNTIDYINLCNTSLALLYGNKAFQQALGTIYPENVTNSDRVSGMDLFSNLSIDQYKTHFQSINSYISPPFDFQSTSSNYKYVPNLGGASDKVYYSRWKDTAYVQAYKVLQYRIRWTKSNFTKEDKDAGTYFNVPADQLRQYPGFIYHCHILPHEDNQMMRPIMLQLPKNSQLNLGTPCNYNIQSKQPNLKWSEKYNCVNKQCGNKPT